MISRCKFKLSFLFLLLFIAISVASSAQIFTTLVTFEGYPTDGATPERMFLVQGTDGNLYGTTQYGGTNNGGTVFRITAAGNLTTLYNFCSLPNCADGTYPIVGLIQATDGNFYGTTGFGGAHNYGTVFRITTGGKLTTLYSFCSQSGCTDGEFPAGLVEGIDGNFYGTTGNGGYITNYCYNNSGCGTAFKITAGGALTILHFFCLERGCTDGENPESGLIQATDGNFYGTTFQGGIDGGTVFQITTEGSLTTLHRFHGATDGAMPLSGLLQAIDGKLYGTTTAGGTNESSGTVFNITLGGRLTTLYNFCSLPNCADGSSPNAGLIQATDGNFYGTTIYGGANQNPACFPYNDFVGCGTTFKITSEGTLTTLYNFCNQQNCTDGAVAAGGLFQASNGEIYGTTSGGGDTSFCSPVDGCGTVFSLNMEFGPFVRTLPVAADIGSGLGILGNNLTGTTSVAINGTSANFVVKSPTLILARVPSGATTGYITVTTPSGVLTSNAPFHVIR
jgi:uncharacterized repeat protein (TIGR03803 family)